MQAGSGRVKSKERALRIVLGMALAIIIAIVICSLIWWFAGNHSFDILGRYINYAGFILIGVGAISLVDRSDARLRKNLKINNIENRRIVERRGRFLDKPLTNISTVMLFFGAGLLCIFTGSMIILGL
jgi:hypothetical protein